MPKRVQMTRNKPWRADNPEAVIVARPSEWGNPYRVGDRFATAKGGWAKIKDRAHAVDLFRSRHIGWKRDLARLRGKDLACWCPLDQPCHADVLLDLANRPIGSVPARAAERGRDGAAQSD